MFHLIQFVNKMLSIPIELQAYILTYLSDYDIALLSSCCHQTQSYYNDYKIRNLMSLIQNKNLNYKNLYHHYFYYKQYYENKIWTSDFGQQITLVQYYHPWQLYVTPLVQFNEVRYNKFTTCRNEEGRYIRFQGSIFH